MQEMNFKITEQDISDYLIRHKNDYEIKNKEAMFVKYMKESNIITQESLEILMKKYNFDDRGYSKQERLSTFTDYLLNIKKLDISGICHIMIPVLTYYKPGKYHCVLNDLNTIINEMDFKHNQDIRDIKNSTMENYAIAYNWDFFYGANSCYHLKFSKGKSKRLIESYSQIYGEEPVKQIRKIIKERV